MHDKDVEKELCQQCGNEKGTNAGECGQCAEFNTLKN